MQIKLSKAQWEAAGQKAGWLKEAQESKALFVEETRPDGSYNILWRDGTPAEAIAFLEDCPSTNRLELWSKAHAGTDKGFAPLAYREANSKQVKVSHTFKFLGLNQTSQEPQKSVDHWGNPEIKPDFRRRDSLGKPVPS